MNFSRFKFQFQPRMHLSLVYTSPATTVYYSSHSKHTGRYSIVYMAIDLHGIMADIIAKFTLSSTVYYTIYNTTEHIRCLSTYTLLTAMDGYAVVLLCHVRACTCVHTYSYHNNTCLCIKCSASIYEQHRVYSWG